MLTRPGNIPIWPVDRGLGPMAPATNPVPAPWSSLRRHTPLRQRGVPVSCFPRHKRPGHRRQRPCLARPAAGVGPRPVSPCPRRRDADAGDATPADDHVINRSISIRSRWVKGRPRGLFGLTAIRAGLPPRRGPGPIRRCHRLLRGPEGPPGNVEGPARSAAVTLIAMVTRR